jgi:hypothetical protein
VRDRLVRQLTELANERTLLSWSGPLDASTKSKAGFVRRYGKTKREEA